MENHIRPRRKGDCVSKNNLCRVICFQKVFACFIRPLIFLTIAKFTSYLISFVDHYGRRPNIILHSMRIILTCSFLFQLYRAHEHGRCQSDRGNEKEFHNCDTSCQPVNNVKQKCKILISLSRTSRVLTSVTGKGKACRTLVINCRLLKDDQVNSRWLCAYITVVIFIST